MKRVAGNATRADIASVKIDARHWNLEARS